MRLAAAIQFGGAAAMRKWWESGTIKFLPHLRGRDTPEIIPIDPFALYKALASMISSKGTWTVRQFIFHYQVAIVLPETKKTDIKQFDIKLHTQLLSNITTVKLEVTPDLPSLDLDEPEVPTGLQLGDYVEYLTQFRNFIMHFPDTNMDRKDFDKYWDLLVVILVGLGYEAEKISDLKEDLPENNHEVEVARTRALVEQASAQVPSTFNNTMIVMNPIGTRQVMNQMQRFIGEGAEIVVRGVQDMGDALADRIQGDAEENKKSIKSLTEEVSGQNNQIQKLREDFRNERLIMIAVFFAVLAIMCFFK